MNIKALFKRSVAIVERRPMAEFTLAELERRATARALDAKPRTMPSTRPALLDRPAPRKDAFPGALPRYVAAQIALDRLEPGPFTFMSIPQACCDAPGLCNHDEQAANPPRVYRR